MLGASSGFDDQEDAAVGSIPGGDPYTLNVYYLGTIGSETVTVLSAKGGGAYNGGNKWWDLPGGYIGYIESDGEITAANYIADAQAQPKAPTGVSAGSATTSTITVSWTNQSAIDEEIWIYYVKNGSNSADSSNISWGANPLSNSTTSDVITGLDSGEDYSFVVYSKNGSTLSAAGSGNRDTAATTTAPTWGSQPSIGTVSTIEDSISYLPTTNPSSFTISLTDPDTDANQVTGTISNKQTAVGDGTWTTITCLVSTSTISNSATGWGTSDTTTAYGSSDTIHFRFRIRSSRSAPQGTAAGTFDFTLSNGGVDSTFTGISWDVGEFIP